MKTNKTPDISGCSTERHKIDVPVMIDGKRYVVEVLVVGSGPESIAIAGKPREVERSLLFQGGFCDT